MHDVFISYSSKDQKIADAIINILETRRIKCWIAYRDADAGDDYAASIVRAIKNCKACVLIFSDDSNHSKHVLNEINSCVNYSKTILPFKIADVLMEEALEYYLGRTHWLDALTGSLEEHINKLADRLDALFEVTPSEHTSIHTGNNTEKKAAAVTAPAEIRMAKYEELVKLGYTADTIAIQLVENDYINSSGGPPGEASGEGFGEDNAGSPSQWAQFIQNYSDTFRYLVNEENRIVGEWSFAVFTEEMFNKAKEGKLLEKDLTFDTCEAIYFPGDYYGYVLTFAILPDYRNMNNYMKLMTSFYAQMEEYAENGIFFKEWVMNVFSPEVEVTMKRLGFAYITDNVSFGKIYYQNFMPLPKNPIIDKFPKLKQLYEERAASG